MKRALKRAGAALAIVLLVLVLFVTVQANRHPPLAPYASLVLPAADLQAPIKVRFAGVSTLVFDDGETTWMTDGFFSRPSMLRTFFGKIEPDRGSIESGLRQLGVKKLAAVVPVHSHYDHALDAPVVAMSTGALLIGSESTLNVGRGLGMQDAQMRRVVPGDVIQIGKWKLSFLASRHAPTPFSDGMRVETIDQPLVPPRHSSAWKEGQTWTLHVEHASGPSMLVNGSAGFVENSLAGKRADIVFVGAGGVGKQSTEYRAKLWDEVVRKTGARQAILIHWDDF